MQENTQESGGEMVVDGVRLSSHVVQELRKNGLDPTQYSAGILREVIAACADGKMIEDHDGGSLLDKLKLTAEEKRKAEEKEEEIEPCEDDEHGHQWSKSCGKRGMATTSYKKHIEEEREAKKWAIHSHDAALHSITS